MSFLSRIMNVKSKGHFSATPRGARREPLSQGPFEGSLKRTNAQAKSRVGIVLVGFTMAYFIIGGRLVEYGLTQPETTSSIMPSDNLLASRPDILDRNGQVLATDIRTVSLYAEPSKIIDPDEALEELSTVLPDLDAKSTYRKLSSKSHFQWLRRQLTPRQQSQILALGIPGIGFRPEKRRFYPGGSVAAHVLGLVNIDNRGIAGMEKYIDSQGLADLAAVGMTNDAKLEPVRLSIDLRVQNILHEVLVDGMTKYQGIGAGAVVLNVHTGEVMGMASVPDFDPNDPTHALDPDRLNRVSAGTYEMGSTFKAFTIAMGIDYGTMTLASTFDATKPLYIGGFTIHDFHGTRRVLTVDEVFVHSSNIGAARMADSVGIDAHKAFLERMGLLTRLNTELPEVATPIQPRVWKRINSMTIAYGHGVATTPLQTAVAGAALVNGGLLIEPTFLPRTVLEADKVAVKVLKPTTVRDMRKLFRDNVTESVGSGKQAAVPGFDVGGKTGTAEKIVHGRYVNGHNFNAFLAAFPMAEPQYMVLVFIDDPRTGEHNSNLAGNTATPMVGRIIGRIAPLLGVQPKFGQDGSATLVSY
jgi:cell division protein FtsI (penicillin-binding protein 3)